MSVCVSVGRSCVQKIVEAEKSKHLLDSHLCGYRQMMYKGHQAMTGCDPFDCTDVIIAPHMMLSGAQFGDTENSDQYRA